MNTKFDKLMAEARQIYADERLEEIRTRKSKLVVSKTYPDEIALLGNKHLREWDEEHELQTFNMFVNELITMQVLLKRKYGEERRIKFENYCDRIMKIKVFL